MISVDDDDDMGVLTVAIDDMDNDDGDDRISAMREDFGDGDESSGGSNVDDNGSDVDGEADAWAAA